MESAEREPFVKMLIAAAELYDKQLSDVLVKIYWKALQQYPLLDVIKAFELHFEDPDGGQFMPKPADIVRVIKGNSQSQSLLAWSKVEESIRLLGPYHSVVFDDELIHAVLQEMGGWIKLCQSTQKEFPFIAKEFQTRYASYRHNKPNSFPKTLTGLTNHQNALGGYESELPYLIGDTQKAQKVLEQGKTDCGLTKINQITSNLNIEHKQPLDEAADARTTKAISQA